MHAQGSDEGGRAPTRSRRGNAATVAGIVLLVAAVVPIGVQWDTFTQAPSVEPNGIWDQLLGTRQVAVAIRLAIVAGAVYVVASVVGLIAQGRWLTRIRGAEVDPARSAEEQLGGLESLDARATRLEEAVEEMRVILTGLIEEHVRRHETTDPQPEDD